MISQAAKKIRSTLVRDSLDDTPIALKREQWEANTRAQPTPDGVVVNTLQVGHVPCLLSIPKQHKSERVIVYCHGGGLVEGSAETFRIWTARLALHTGCNVICVDYRLAPEFPYPAAIEDVLSVCRSLLSNVKFSAGISIGADSSGCILALSALLKLRPYHQNNVHGSFLLSPSIDLTFSGMSIFENSAADPVVCLDVLEYYAELYGAGKDLRDPNISPLFADLSDIPPMLIMADSNEILLDDSTRLVQKILASSGLAKLHAVDGLWHVWPAWGEFPESKIALEMIRQHVLCSDPVVSD